MLDGLDATVIKLSEIIEASDTFRTDSEFWKKSFVQVRKTLEKMQTVSVQDISKRVVCGPFGSSILDTTYQETGVLMVRPFNIKEMGIEDENLVFIPKEHIEANNLKLFHAGALMFARVGEVACGVLTYPEATISPNIIAADISSKEFSSYFLAVFFNTKYGRLQMERELKVVAQPTLSTETIKSLRVPKLSIDFQKQIEKTVKVAHAKLEASKSLYAQAEATLLDELGLKNWKPPKESAAVKTFKESFGKSGRLDAEFYQPKYDKLFAHLRKTGQAVRLGDWVREPIKRGTQPKYADDGEMLVINSQHVGKTEIELESNSRTTKEFAKENERAVVGKYDVLLNSTGYITIGRCQTLLEDITAVVDGHVAIIRPKQGLDPVFLSLYLNALPGQLQTEQGWTGSSGQIELRRDIVENYIVWKPDMKIQTRIHKLVENAYSAEQESKRLLELSERAVEVSIERGERSGLKVLTG